jgi:N-acetyl-1-D-myo-inositol-2-amino-2-deoxy-alpha-D-glucopyranoside deacetylase
MAGSPAASHPRAFAGADVDEAATLLAEQLAAIAPDVVLTYDPEGGYRHPDHVQTHRVTVAATRQLLAAGGSGPRLYVALTPQSWVREDRRWLAEHVPDATRSPDGGTVSVPKEDDPVPPSVVDDARVTHAVVDPSAVPAQVAALREHPTQVTVHDGWYALSNDIAARLPGREGYARWDGASA